MKYKILLIEDDESSALLIKEFLQEYDFCVDIVNTVTDAVSNISINKYCVVLLDINLPDFNGFEVLKFLNRNKINLPVLIISAYSDRNTKLQAFKLGVNDYMVKPVDPEELEARIWVQIKNSSTFALKEPKNTLFKIDENMILFNDNPLKLTKTEFEILSYLIKNKNQTITREKLTDFLSSIIQSDRSLDYHIKNIRIKLGDNGANPRYLLTEYGVGYRLFF